MFVNRLKHQNNLVNPKKRLPFSILLYTVLCLFLLLSLYHNLSALFESKNELNNANSKLEEAAETLRQNEAKLKNIGTSTYVDQVARDTLGLSKPGELTLVIPSTEDLKKLSPRLFEKQKEVLQVPPTYKKWLQFLF